MNRGPHWFVGGRRLSAALLAAVGLAACGGEAGPEFGPPSEPSNSGGTGEYLPVCTEGTTRACTIELGEYSGVRSCYTGVQRCTGDAWSPCEPAPPVPTDTGSLN